MNLPELPEPDFMEGGRDWPRRGAWIETQIREYGKACYRKAIEDAANACQKLEDDCNWDRYAGECPDVIRVLLT